MALFNDKKLSCPLRYRPHKNTKIRKWLFHTGTVLRLIV